MLLEFIMPNTLLLGFHYLMNGIQKQKNKYMMDSSVSSILIMIDFMIFSFFKFS